MVRLLRKKTGNTCGTEITPSELQEALKYCVHAVQQIAFYSELKLLTEGQELNRTSSLLRLLPFVDGHGLLRLGGRLHNSMLPTSRKHPYILPKESPLSTLIIRDAHEKTLHGSTQETLNYIRNQFWILGGRAPVRSFILKCVNCTRYRRKRMQQLMGQLPTTRVTPAGPFEHTGVDYAGPFTLKTWNTRRAKTYKAWISLFVCQATSAIHLEIVTNYTTDAFLAAFRRFVSRRGIPSTMWSDCGTTFKGAQQELKAMFDQHSAELKKIGTQATPIATGTMVLIMDEQYPPSKWPLGRIVKTHPGKDNVVRVVTVKTGSKTFVRPIVKLCILPVLSTENNGSTLGGSTAGENVQNP